MTPAEDYARSAAYTLLQADAPAVVVALHGLGGDRSQPLSSFGDFGPEFAVLAPDLRAHGESAAPADPTRLTFPALAEDVAALIRLLGLADRPVYLAGISMGAAVSLTLLRDRSLNICGASLVRPAFGSEPLLENLALMPQVAALLRLHGPERGGELLVGSPAYRRLERQSRAAAESLRAQFDKPHALERLARLTVVPSQLAYASAEELAVIAVPVQIIGAHGDPVHPLALAREWAGLIPGATLVEVVSRDVDAQEYADAIRGSVAQHAVSSNLKLTKHT